MASGADIAKAYVQIIPSAEGIKGRLTDIMGGEADSAGRSAGGRFASVFGKFAKVGVAAIGAAAAGVAALTKSAVNAYAEYEQLAGGVEKIFDKANISQIMADANAAYKDLNMSVNEYLAAINQTGAAFAQTMGDQKGYDVARTGMKAIADYASGTGRNLEELNEKFSLITRSTASYQSIADQFSGILPATSKDFLEQAQAAGFLEEAYTSLTEVPIAEYQEAVSKMLEKGVADMGLAGNTAAESMQTISGSLAMTRSAWSNLMTGLADDSADFDTLISNFVTSAGALSDNLMPRITTAISGIGQLVSALAPQLAAALPAMLTSALPALLSAASSLVQGFVGAISSSLPIIVQEGVPIILSLVEGIVQNLPMLVEAGLQIIVELANGLSESLPELVPVIVDVMLQIVDTLIDNLDLLVEASVQIIVALAEGLIAATPQLVEKAPEIILKLLAALIQAIPILLQAGLQIIVMIGQGIAGAIGQLLAKGRDVVVNVARGIAGAAGQLVAKGRDLVARVGNGIRGALSSAASWGRDLVQNFVNGITSRLSSLASTVSNMASTIRSHLHFSEPDVGPLSDFHTYAPDMMELFAKGIRDNKQMLLDTVDDAFNFQDMIVSPTLGFSANVAAQSGETKRGVSIYGGINITIDGRGKDASELARELQIELQRRIPAWA